MNQDRSVESLSRRVETFIAAKNFIQMPMVLKFDIQQAHIGLMVSTYFCLQCVLSSDKKRFRLWGTHS